MDKTEYDAILSRDEQKAKDSLSKFIKNNSQVFTFPSMVSSGQWATILNSLFQYLSSPNCSIFPECLSTIKILSRDKTFLNETITDDNIDCLLNIANIGSQNYNLNETIQVEALKCLCNLIFQSKNCQDYCLINSSIEGIIKRLRTYKEQNVIYDVKFFDMKLLFLITALNSNVRTKVRDDHHGLIYLVETLDLFMKNSINNEFFDAEVDLINEVLKVIFNLTVRSDTTIPTEEEEESQFQRLSIVIHDLLLFKTLTKEKLIDLRSNIVNLLTSVPTACFTELTTPAVANLENNKKISSKIFENYNMNVIDVLIDFLRNRLEMYDEQRISQYDMLLPVLTVFLKLVKCSSLLRRYIRSVILPPLRDVSKRPEEGTKLRNYLCKLLTSSALQTADLAGEFLFIMCKENVGRMIKYTGYGNAAGLFAKRGLLGGNGRSSLDYSSDSEDSDTEEYKQIQRDINPVLGCYEPPKISPLEGMSEEEKEYEAMKLVNVMEQLHRQGIIKPCRIGVDGRPEPVEHILELQEGLPEQQRDQKRKT